MSGRIGYVARQGTVYAVRVDHLFRDEAKERWCAAISFIERVPRDLWVDRGVTVGQMISVPVEIVRDTKDEAERDAAFRKLRGE